MTSIQKAQKASKNPNHDKYWRINSLPDDMRDLIIDLLKQHSPRMVAETIREAGYHLDIQPITLMHCLETYRREKISADECLNPYIIEKLSSRLKTSVNCFAEMSELISLQKERIRLARFEELDGKLSPEVNKQVHLMTRMIKVYSDMGIKAGLMGTFVSEFNRDSKENEEAEVFDVRNIFFRILRNIGLDSPEKLTALINNNYMIE